MEKFASFINEDKDLVKAFKNVSKKAAYIAVNDDNEIINDVSELNGIRIGDMIIFEINGIESKGNVEKIINEKYIVNKTIIDFLQIIEHYPKNNNFINDTNEEISSDLMKKNWSDLPKKQRNRTFLKEDKEKNESVILFPDNTSQKDIEKLLPKYKKVKYFIVEKNNGELHVVKRKDGFNMKLFMESLMTHLKTKNLIVDDISKMKIIGNDNFVIIQNSPLKLKNLIKETLEIILK